MKDKFNKAGETAGIKNLFLVLSNAIKKENQPTKIK